MLLEHLVQKRSVNDADVCGLISQLLDALTYLHSRTIFHLDVRVGTADNTLRLQLFASTVFFYDWREKHKVPISTCN